MVWTRQTRSAVLELFFLLMYVLWRKHPNVIETVDVGVGSLGKYYSHNTCTTWRSVCFHQQLVSQSRFTFSSGMLALANLCILILFPNPSQEGSLLPQWWIKFNDCQYDIHVIALSDTAHKRGLTLPLSFEKRAAQLQAVTLSLWCFQKWSSINTRWEHLSLDGQAPLKYNF